MPSFFIDFEGITLNLLQETLSSAFPQGDFICTLISSDKPNLQDEIQNLNKIIDDLKLELDFSRSVLKSTEIKYSGIIDELSSFKEKYEASQLNVLETLWLRCAGFHPSTKDVPKIITCKESSSRIGPYTIDQLIGEGQFGSVLSCSKDGVDCKFAVKIILKNKIETFKKLCRLSAEISNLQHLKSPYVISLIDVVHTSTKLYIITTKGGPDLFDFLDSYLNGVNEIWTKEIMFSISQAVNHCHQQGICHRDIKPENILMVFDTEKGIILDLKLCDFGLSSRFDPTVVLNDFCGSPGFMAPEIVSGYDYNEKVDVWSTGCVMMELLIGPEAFSEYWMSSYEPYIIEEKNKFRNSIKYAIEKLTSTFLPIHTDMSNLIENMLDINPIQRFSIVEVVEHSWFHKILSPMKRKSKANRNSLSIGRKFSSNKVFPIVQRAISPIKTVATATTNHLSPSFCDSISHKSSSSTNVSCKVMRNNSDNSFYIDKKASGEFYIWNTNIVMLLVDSSAVARSHYVKLFNGRCQQCVEVQSSSEALEAIKRSMPDDIRSTQLELQLELLAVSNPPGTKSFPEGFPEANPGSSHTAFDVIIVDYALPDLDGPSTVRAARSLGYTGVVIGVIDARDRVAREGFLTARVDYVLERPVDVLKLNRILADRFD